MVISVLLVNGNAGVMSVDGWFLAAPVSPPHLRPRQVGIEQPLAINADRVPVPAGGPGQRGDIAHRVGGLVRGQVSGVGDPAAGFLGGWALTSWPR